MRWLVMLLLCSAVDVRGAGGESFDQGWQVWWEQNRENLIGFRHLLHGKGVVTGAVKASEPPDPLGGYRGHILKVLRDLARGDERIVLRTSAILAIGRMGVDQDAVLLLDLVRDAAQPAAVRETAAVALGVLPDIKSDATAAEVRDGIQRELRARDRLPKRTRELFLIGAGLRARQDRPTLMRLAALAVRGVRSADDAAALAFAYGLAGDRMLASELLRAVRDGKLAGQALNDTARSHAALALGRLKDAAVVDPLVSFLRSPHLGVQTRRAAALALGRLLASGFVVGPEARRGTQALVETFAGKGDIMLRGFAALAAGAAAEPSGEKRFVRALEHGPQAELRPFAALALGLMARDRANARARRIRTVLARELKQVKSQELRAALCIAAGLARAVTTGETLLRTVESKSLPSNVRGAAAQGYGLFDRVALPNRRRLARQLRKAPRDLVGDVALGLGLLGHRSSGLDMTRLLPRANASTHRGRIMLALGHMGHSASTQPLMEILEDSRQQTLSRAFAAVALGLLGDGRKQDVLFDIDGWFNYFATTDATRTLIGMY